MMQPKPRAVETLQAGPPRAGTMRSRRGIGVVSALAAFVVIVTICAVWTRSTLRQHRDVQLAEERVQAAWLADAGARRGAARLASDEAYAGETWEIAADQLGRARGAAVVITIEPAAGPRGRVRIVARASYPRDRARVRATKTVHFTPRASESPL